MSTGFWGKEGFLQGEQKEGEEKRANLWKIPGIDRQNEGRVKRNCKTALTGRAGRGIIQHTDKGVRLLEEAILSPWEPGAFFALFPQRFAGCET